MKVKIRVCYRNIGNTIVKVVLVNTKAIYIKYLKYNVQPYNILYALALVKITLTIILS